MHDPHFRLLVSLSRLLFSGFRVFVMERLGEPFFAMIDHLVKVQTTRLSIGPIALRMLDCLREFHSKGVLFRDIKPDNFMLAKEGSKKRRKATAKSVVEDLAESIRWLDLGCVAMYKSMTNQHEEDAFLGVIGTPNYASLHMHEGHSPSRRDDYFALGLVLVEFVCRLYSRLNGTSDQFERKGKRPSYLPWANESSEEALGRCKREQVLSRRSELYAADRLPREVANAFFDYFELCHNLEFKEKPPIDMLENLLKDITIPYTMVKKKASTKSPPRSAAGPSQRFSNGETPPRRTTRASARASQESAGEPESVSGKPTPYRIPRSSPSRGRGKTSKEASMSPDRATRRGRAKADDSGTSSKRPRVFADDQPRGSSYAKPLDIDDSDEDEIMEDAEEYAYYDAMDVDEDEPGADAKAPPATQQSSGAGLKLVVQGGVDVGKAYVVTKDSVNKFVVGTKPRSGSGTGKIVLQGAGVANSHAKFDCFFRKGDCRGIEVTNLAGDGETLVGNKSVLTKKVKAAFPGDTIRIGGTTFLVQAWSGGETENRGGKENVVHL